MANIFKNFEEEESLATKTREEALLPTDYTVQQSLKPLKFAIVAGFVLSLAALGGAAYLYQAFSAERSERESIQAGQKEVIENAGALEEQVTQYKTVIERMREQIANYAQERKDFKQEFERNQGEMTKLQTKVQALEDRNRQMQAETDRIKKELNMTETQLSSAQQTLTSSQTELIEARQQLAAAETTIEQTESKPPGEPAVLSINREYNFAVVNLGKKDGVRIGDKLNVFRAGKPIGLVQVEKLYDNFTAAAIVKEAKDVQMQQGDQIRLGT